MVGCRLQFGAPTGAVARRGVPQELAHGGAQSPRPCESKNILVFQGNIQRVRSHWTNVVLPGANVALAKHCSVSARAASLVVLNGLRRVVHKDVLWHNG